MIVLWITLFVFVIGTLAGVGLSDHESIPVVGKRVNNVVKVLIIYVLIPWLLLFIFSVKEIKSTDNELIYVKQEEMEIKDPQYQYQLELAYHLLTDKYTSNVASAYVQLGELFQEDERYFDYDWRDEVFELISYIRDWSEVIISEDIIPDRFHGVHSLYVEGATKNQSSMQKLAEFIDGDFEDDHLAYQAWLDIEEGSSLTQEANNELEKYE